MSKVFEQTDVLYDNDEYAGDYYKIYLENTNEKLIVGRWFVDNARKLIEPLLKNSINSINILSIGSGHGSPDCYLLDSICDEFNAIQYTVYDPSVKMTDEFKDTVKDRRYPNVNFDWQIKPSKEFLSSSKEENKEYHIILCLNVLYYIPERDELVQCLYDRLHKNGTMMLSVVTEGCGWHRIWTEFEERIEQSLGSETNICGKYLVDYFGGRGIPYEVEVLDCVIKLDDNLTPGCAAGIKAIEYIVDVRQFTEEPISLQKEIISFAKEKCSIQENGHFYFDSSQQMFLVQKNH